MAKAKAILRRRRVVQNTRKITRTMELVSTAKYRQSFNRVENARPFRDTMHEMMQDLARADVPFERVRALDRPVYYSYGSLSNETWERKATRLTALLPNVTVERYEGLSHLETSHLIEPERVAAALRRLWASASG